MRPVSAHALHTVQHCEYSEQQAGDENGEEDYRENCHDAQ
jgi:hypothetical protein